MTGGLKMGSGYCWGRPARMEGRVELAPEPRPDPPAVDEVPPPVWVVAELVELGWYAQQPRARSVRYGAMFCRWRSTLHVPTRAALSYQ